MNNAFFYSINVNDRMRFPLLGELKRDSVPSDTLSMDVDTTILEEELTSDIHQKVFGKTNTNEEESYFESFKHTNEKGLYCDEILSILETFFKSKHASPLHPSPWRTLPSFLDSFSNYFNTHHDDFRQLMDIMNTKRLITPYIELDLPVTIIQEFQKLEQDDPRIQLYQLNPVWGPAIKEFGFFWERFESTKEVLCLFIWSTIDHSVVPLPAVGLNPYPLCWVCDKGFGTLACNQCHVAKYCSKECLQKDWIRHGGPVCDLMASSLRRVKKLTFKRPASPPASASPSPSSLASSPSSSTTINSSSSKKQKNMKNNKTKSSNNNSTHSFNAPISTNSSNSSNSSISSSSSPSSSLSPSPSSSPPPSPPLSSQNDAHSQKPSHPHYHYHSYYNPYYPSQEFDAEPPFSYTECI